MWAKITILIFISANLLSQSHCCLDSLSFYERNHIKTIDILTFQEKEIVNKVRYSFNKNNRILLICSVLNNESASNCKTVDFKQINDSLASPEFVKINDIT